jgi:uncharacterized Zn-binding protein involved in type VI secretion
MAAVARLNDTTDHGGVIISASPDVFADGIKVARVGDNHSCPIQGHGVTSIETGSNTSFANNKKIARVGDSVGCGATIISGSPTTFVE